MRDSVLLLGGAVIAASLAALIDLGLARSYLAQDPIDSALACYLVGATVGVFTQGALAQVCGRRGRSESQGRPTHGVLPLAVPCGALDVMSIVAWLFALANGDPPLVLALGSVTPLVVGGWEIITGRLDLRRGGPSLALVTAGLLALATGRTAHALPAACALALIIRTGCRASTELVERHVGAGAVFDFAGVRFASMAVVGVTTVLAWAVASGHVGPVLCCLSATSATLIGLQALSHVLWFTVNVIRVDSKRRLDSITLPAAALATPPILASLATPSAHQILPSVYPNTDISAQIVVGAVLVASGAVWLAVARTIHHAPALRIQPRAATGR